MSGLRLCNAGLIPFVHCIFQNFPHANSDLVLILITGRVRSVGLRATPGSDFTGVFSMTKNFGVVFGASRDPSAARLERRVLFAFPHLRAEIISAARELGTAGTGAGSVAADRTLLLNLLGAMVSLSSSLSKHCIFVLPKHFFDPRRPSDNGLVFQQ